jgi:hypothetical protein
MQTVSKVLLEEINGSFQWNWFYLYDQSRLFSDSIGFLWVRIKTGLRVKKPDLAKRSGSEIEILNKSNMMKMCCYFSTLSNFKRAIIGFRVKHFITVQSIIDSSVVVYFPLFSRF